MMTDRSSACDPPEDRTDTASDDWDAHWTAFGDSSLQNPANDYRIGLILRSLADPEPGSAIVDIGSGQGQLALRLQERFPQSRVVGVEYSAEGVRHATDAASAAGLGACFVQRDLLKPAAAGVPQSSLPRASQAVCSEVLEHVDEPQLLLRNASDYMLEGCRLVVTVPGGPMSALDRHIGHRRHYTPGSLREVLEGGGFSIEKISRAGFPFFNLYRLAVVARGQKLIDDVDADSGDRLPPRTQRFVSRFFAAAFRANMRSSPFGWQMVAVARLHGA